MASHRPRDVIRLSAVALALSLAGCSFDELSRPIQTDLTGSWPVTCGDLFPNQTANACRLSGLTLDIRQDGGGAENGTFGGTYSGATLSCADGKVARTEPGSLQGDFQRSVFSVRFSSGSLFGGRINRPTTSISLVALEGIMQWAAGGPSAGGQCTAGPIETRSR